jgi:uncharacterized membrane protein
MVAAAISAHKLFPVACFAAGMLAFAQPATAQFAICNQTLDVLNVAIAQDVQGPMGASDRAFESEGWWTIGANRCVNVIRTELASRYIYVYATDVFGQPTLEGDTDMCVGPKKFLIRGGDSCWQRGHKLVRFMEVDTQAVERWTLFLKEPEAQ